MSFDFKRIFEKRPTLYYTESTDISRKRWSEQMDIENLIGETTEYDKKAALEVKKPKSWCKSVSAFANTLGGALIFGMADDGQIVGLTEPDSDAEKISEILKTRMEPIRKRSIITRQGQKSTSDRKCRKSGKMAILRDGLRPREKRFELFHCRRFTKFGKLLQQKQQIPKGIKTISLCGFDHTEAQRTCICALRGVTKQEVPPGHNERLHGPLCKIVGKCQTAIQQDTFESFPLVQRISLCLAKIGILVSLKAVQKLPILIHNRFQLCQAMCLSVIRRQILPRRIQRKDFLSTYSNAF